MAGMVVIDGGKGGETQEPAATGVAKATAAQVKYLSFGLNQPGGKLPLFDEQGQEIRASTIRSCIEKGWAEPWFDNPVKPGWLVCKLTKAGRLVAEGKTR